MPMPSRVPVLPFPDPAVDAVRQLLSALGENPAREGLQRTPERVARALSFLTSGYDQEPGSVLNGAVFHEEHRGLVLVRDIEFYSLCEHHMLPFHGRVHVAYLPQGRILGLSKLPRLVDVYARRLQVQERLTAQVASAVEQAVAPRGVAVLVDAAHFCMMMRGVERQHSRTTTTEFRGAYETDPALRTEFLAAVGTPVPSAPSPSTR